MVLLRVLKLKMTAAGAVAVPLGVSKVTALKKKIMTKMVIIFLKQVTFIFKFLLKNSNATKHYSVITEMVSLRGVNKVQAMPTK